MSDLLNDPRVLEIIAGLVALLWGAIRSTEFYRSIRDGRIQTLMAHIEEAVEAGVVTTYQEYVEGIKRGIGGGKLTPEQTRNARAAARMSAINNARARGIDLLKTIGEDGIALAIESAVKRQKGIAE